ncbi:hypothetical protein FFLO_06428 [Filobasidium floriforme]|uniref:Uncharacterized protein n=1 Tax=Filobasidium floriforme TaxID=5210 RepID=A0A8K0JH97_9TREE|nr:hypothetical protein FFLO_06428 [Filobasidium floriforme]
MTQHGHDPLLPGCGDTPTTEDYDKWFTETWGGQASQRSSSPQVSARWNSADEELSVGTAAGLTTEKSVISRAQHDATDAECAPSAHTPMRSRGLEHRDRDPLQHERDALFPVSSTSSILDPNTSLVFQLLAETLYSSHTPASSQNTLFPRDDSSVDPPTHETDSDPPTDQDLSMSPILPGSLHCARNFHLYRNTGVKHLWYVVFTPRSESDKDHNGFQIEFFPPRGRMNTSGVYTTVRNRVSRIKYQWNFLVSEMSLNKAGDPPAFFLLANDNPIISLLTERALKEISKQLKVIMMPFRRQCQSKKERIAWISENRQRWITTIDELNSRMAVLGLALQVRDMLNYMAGTRLASYARLDETETAESLANKRDILWYQAGTYRLVNHL